MVIPMKVNINILTKNIQRTLTDAHIVETPLQLCPDIKLFLLSANNLKRQFTSDEICVVQNSTPYWSFCWASGQAMAYYILRNIKFFEGKRILDFGSGSGVVAIAAAMAGAEKVVACDSDGDAIDAVRVNAMLNDVQIRTCKSLHDLSHCFDMIITADVLYDRENHSLLEKFLTYAPEIFVADSRIKTIDVIPYQKLAEITTTTLPDLHEGDEFNHVSIYHAISLYRARR
jgi:predicted nicotinamide N-methyase